MSTISEKEIPYLVKPFMADWISMNSPAEMRKKKFATMVQKSMRTEEITASEKVEQQMNIARMSTFTTHSPEQTEFQQSVEWQSMLTYQLIIINQIFKL